ncbi:MAG TPA: lysozyme inhibitor LprI family protein [Casimicrobiaceae bacterium]|nr:lysozyme inhibitor LprI family protein [Casimicrobiaceae bacterium]
MTTTRTLGMLRALALVALGGAAAGATAGAYEDCMTRGAQPAVMQCLLNEERDAATELAGAEAAVAQKARSVEQATGKPGIHAALAKSVRDFAAYRASQCGFVRELAAREPVGEQAQIACRVDLTRRRVRELKP